MMKKILVISVIVLLFAFKLDKPAYNLFNNSGEKVDYSQMLDDLSQADVIFFGELHNNAIAHWLEYEIAKDLINIKGEKLIFGAEMFESDNQLILDEYLNDVITEKKFEAEARIWPNYSTDYKPLVNLAKESKSKFIATNIPRRYASVVAKKGYEGLNKLSSEAKKYLATLPINFDSEVACYKNMMKMSRMPAMKGGPNMNIAKAQAAKDATMAYFINKNYSKDKIFIHYNGSYHSDNNEGIIWHLKKLNPELKIKTITTISQENIENIDKENNKKANYTLLVPSAMTNTY
ncbi:MAG: ChaN family lipoprotein [Bacteroidota bacterium]|nr:ChaN family lipoprotein [Bacteroidota bacterium]